MKPKVLVCDMSVVKNSPAGSCVLTELLGLADHFDITLVTTEVDPDLAAKVEAHVIPPAKGPLIVKYRRFQTKARRLARKLRAENEYVLVQTTQGQLDAATLSYSHFCHTSYLRNTFDKAGFTGLKRVLRRMLHRFQSKCELAAWERVGTIVAPSKGLGREITAVDTGYAQKLEVLSNPVDCQRFTPPTPEEKAAARADLKLDDLDFVLSFVALGDFERKGLRYAIEALAEPGCERAKVLIIGGSETATSSYREMAEKLGVAARVVFVGFQRDVRPFLWASDAYVFPSIYEVFALAPLQAMAAGLPILSTVINGSEEYLEDGENGFVIERSPESVAAAIRKLIDDPERTREMGAKARKTAEQYSVEAFQSKWLVLWKRLTTT